MSDEYMRRGSTLKRREGKLVNSVIIISGHKNGKLSIWENFEHKETL